MKKIRVRMTGSRIREKPVTKKVMDSLGLKRIGTVREYPYNESVMGMIKKVIHLVSYEIIETEAKK